MRATALTILACLVSQPTLAHPAGPGEACTHDAAAGPPAIAAKARANLASYVSKADYPASAVRAREEGLVEFRLGVAPNGRVSECTILSSSGSAALDSTTCRLMKSRARFTPATDDKGKPVPDSTTAKIKWTAPPVPHAEPVPVTQN
jgi:protein TonB